MRLRDEHGMTLVELLAAMMAGMVVLMGAYSVVDLAVKTQKDADSRVSTVAKGRLAMEDMTRQIRSQICLNKETVPILEARRNRIRFYASLAPAAATTTFQQRTIEYIPNADGTRGRIDETVVTGTGTVPNISFSGTPVTRTIVKDVRPQGAGLFRYYAFDAPTAPNMREVTSDTDVVEGERRLTVQVRIAFEVLPEPGRPTRFGSLFENTVFVRTADPTDPTRSPKCS